MQAIFTALFTGLVLAGIAGLAALAFNKPAVYNRIHINLLFASLFINFLAFVWCAGARYTLGALIPFVPKEKMAEATARVAEYSIDPTFTLLVAMVATMYILLLYWLANHVIDVEEDSQDKK